MTDTQKAFIGIIVTLFFVGFLFLFFTNWAGATYSCSEWCNITPVISVEPTVEPTTEPTATPTEEPTLTPTSTPSANQGGVVDDGLGCANHDCNTHKNDKPQVPAGPPNTGYGPTLYPQVGWK